MPPVPSLFEEFRPGMRFTGGPRVVTAQDLDHMIAASGDRHALHVDPAYAQQAGFAAPLLHGPFGIGAFLGWFHETGIGHDTVLAMLDSNWKYLRPILVGDALSFEMVVTRCRRASKGDRGVVGRHIRIRNGTGDLVQEGRSAMLVRAGEAAADPAREFFSPAWARALAGRLAADPVFRSATATWDGAIGLACAEDEVQLRIFKGQVIEAGTRSPNGPAFTLEAGELIWVELFTGPANDLMQRQMQGQFSVRGSAYEYLRLTKALVAIVDAARTLFAGAPA